MTPKSLVSALAVLLLVAMPLSCGGSSKNEEGEQAEQQEETAEKGEGAVPESVAAIEGEAEDAIDLVFAGNWDKVATDAASIATNWSDFTASSEAGGLSAAQRQAMDKAVSDLKDAAESEDDLAARQAANDVSKVIVDVFDLFDVKVPTDVGRLDWLERQVIIDADRDDWSTVKADLAQTRDTFNRVKGDIAVAGGDNEVEDYRASLDRQDQLAASEDSSIVDEANVALELVDDLERVY